MCAVFIFRCSQILDYDSYEGNSGSLGHSGAIEKSLCNIAGLWIGKFEAINVDLNKVVQVKHIIHDKLDIHLQSLLQSWT